MNRQYGISARRYGPNSGAMIVFVDPTEVRAALRETSLVPHRSGDQSTGSTMQLRAAMARFSGPVEHVDRRRAVVEAVSHVDEDRVGKIAFECTARRLVAEYVDVMGMVAKVVPTEALATVLGMDGPSDEVVADVEAVVRVIGRGEPASAEVDASTDRLLARCGRLPAGAVPTASLLYQNFDATAALIGTRLLAGTTTDPAVAAVPRTRRVARSDVVVGGVDVPAGTEVVLEIGSAGLWFGAGPHQCPGERLAESIVAGVVAAISGAGYEVLRDEATFDDDGRPTHLPCRRGRSPSPS